MRRIFGATSSATPQSTSGFLSKGSIPCLLAGGSSALYAQIDAETAPPSQAIIAARALWQGAPDPCPADCPVAAGRRAGLRAAPLRLRHRANGRRHPARAAICGRSGRGCAECRCRAAHAPAHVGAPWLRAPPAAGGGARTPLGTPATRPHGARDLEDAPPRREADPARPCQL